MDLFTEGDISAIESHGLTVAQAEEQIEQFKKGFPYADLQAPATPGNGIVQLSEKQVSTLEKEYDKLVQGEKVIKFVPASGAASRMFKKLFAFADSFSGTPEDFEALTSDQSTGSMHYFFENLHEFSFIDELKQVLHKNNLDLAELMASKDYKTIVEYILNDKGLGYGSLPKGLIHFHTYEDEVRLAFEEHIVEAYNYCLQENSVKLHFTVSPEHMELFEKQAEYLSGKYKNLYGIAPQISFSVQKLSTDTLAVNPDNTLFRGTDGAPVFRPGGHGALIENLNELDAGLIFIKNIDNVVPDRIKDETYAYKKACGALLLEMKNRVFRYLEILDNAEVSDEEIQEMYAFALNDLFIAEEKEFNSYNRIERIDFLYNALNRPMRICGMVKNEGEPGGGPFWVKDLDGKISLQIIEGAQIDRKNPEQEKILAASTHFNPVDLICSTIDYKNENFDLRQYIDRNTGFISEKSKDGKPLKALELPGLWNGAMANWITVFVEVPLITFNPVKEVNDLLRPNHL
ncbi:MAG: DUF4301 domain-containing protein [Marinilabiliales bacterium]|nr:MAG: DUF4301 domain-containing protein [Marinilabiliales bacterium]